MRAGNNEVSRKNRKAGDHVAEEEALVELFEQILLNGTNENRRYCRYCKAKMILPIELHRDDCLWRRAWKLVNDLKKRQNSPRLSSS